MTAVEENASVYQVNPVSRISGEGRAEIYRGTYHYAYARQTQVNGKKEKNRKDRRKKRGTLMRFKITLCQAEAGAHCSYLLWSIYWLLVCRDMAI